MNNNSSSKKTKAINLRKRGFSYANISNELTIPKSTLSSWLSKLDFSKNIKNQNIQNNKLQAAKNITRFNREKSIKYKEEMIQEIEEYASEIEEINQRDLFFIGLGLFLAEGSRREKWMVRFVNSDPLIIAIAMRFFREICQIDEDSVRARIHIHPNCDYVQSLKYWSNLSNIPEKYFWTPQILVSKSSKGKRSSNQLKYGTLHVTIMNAKTLRKLIGWSKGLANQMTLPNKMPR